MRELTAAVCAVMSKKYHFFLIYAMIAEEFYNIGPPVLKKEDNSVVIFLDVIFTGGDIQYSKERIRSEI